jgi:hypothetical protein
MEVFSGVRVTQSLVLCVCFVDRCLSFCPFYFGHCVVFLLQFTDSDYRFGIFKLFFENNNPPSPQINEHKNPLHMTLEIHIPHWDRHKHLTWLNQWNGAPLYWIVHCVVFLLQFTDSDYRFGIFKLFLNA